MNGEFLSMYYRGARGDRDVDDDGAGADVRPPGFLHLVPMLQVWILGLRILTSRSQYATGSIRICTCIETGTCTQATPSKRVREEVPRLRSKRDAGEKAMELVQSHSQRILSYSSSPAYVGVL